MIDTTEENIGGLTEQLAAPQAQMTNLENDGDGRRAPGVHDSRRAA